MKKILLIGDEKRAPYHPLQRVLPFLEDALDGLGELSIAIDDYSVLNPEFLSGFSCIVSYADCFSTQLTKENAAALLSYIARGGKLLAIHGGTICREHEDLMQLLGARFINHPAACLLDYRFEGDHPIIRDLKPFSVTEEPYQYEWDRVAPVQVLMSYRYGTAQCPAMWLRSYGWGQVIGFAIGHHPSAFLPEVRQLIYRAAAFLLGRL